MPLALCLHDAAENFFPGGGLSLGAFKVCIGLLRCAGKIGQVENIALLARCAGVRAKGFA
jgi:hypothetical protein